MQTKTPARPAHQPRILVIDDEATFTRLLKLNLEGTDRYIVRVENDPTLAAATALSFRPDLVLLDVMMPLLDGGDVATMFGKHKLLHKVPIVFLTAAVKHAEVDAHHGCFGGHEFLSKPVVMSQLLEYLDRKFEGRRASIWMHHA